MVGGCWDLPMQFFIDSGSYYSIISEKWVKELGLTPQQMEKPIRVLPISNQPLPISHFVELSVSFDETVVAPLTFYVVRH